MREFHVNQSPEAHYTVYKLTSPTGKIYIGCTGMKPKRRWCNGKGYKNKILKEDIEKFGWTAFTKEIVCEKLTQKGAEKIEKKLIELFESRDPEKGYNVYTGGPRKGAVMSENGVERLREGILEAYEKDPTYNIRHSETLRKLYAEKPEIIEQIKETCKNTRSTEEYKNKISAIRKEYRKKNGGIDFKPAIQVYCFELKKVFSSMMEAERETNVNHGGIGQVCRGLKYTAGGYHWKFA